MNNEYILELKDLRVGLRSAKDGKNIIKGVDLQLMPGDKLGVVGSSGGGKSLTFSASMGFLDQRQWNIQGESIYKGQENILTMKNEEREVFRRKKLGYIPQNALNSLNPHMKIIDQMSQNISFCNGVSKHEAKDIAIDGLEFIGIEPTRANLNKYPHQFSGGMRQRTLMAMVLAKEPEIILADEPSSALDVLNQARSVELLQRLIERYSFTMIYISHIPGMVRKLCNKIIVFGQGIVVESGDADEVLDMPVSTHTNNGVKISPERTPILQVENIWKTFDCKEKPVLKGVSFTLYEGEILGLAGVSGCGKSTLSRIITGIIPMDSGNVLFRDREIPGIGSRDRSLDRFPVQMIFQNAIASFNQDYTIEYSLKEACIASGMDRENIDEEIRSIISECDLPIEIIKKKPTQVSGGQMQRLAISRALLTKPKVLIADEIISALDLSTQIKILDLLKNLAKKRNLSVIFIARDLMAVRRVADRAVILFEGKKVFDQEPQKIWSQEVHPHVKELADAVEKVNLNLKNDED